MSETRVSRINTLRENFVKHHNNECMLTGIKSNVVLAHILPHSTKARVCQTLGMVGLINDDRNLLFLCSGLERAFDRLLISFVPDKSNFKANCFKLHVWSESVLEMPLYEHSKKKIKKLKQQGKIIPTIPKIKDYLNRIMDFSLLQHNPFRRCLSYQAFMAYWKWKKLGCESIEEPEDFDHSDNDGDFKANREYYSSEFISDCRLELGDVDVINEI